MKTRALFLAACFAVFSAAHAQFDTGGGAPAPKQDAPAVAMPVAQIVGTLEPRNLGPTTMGGRVTDIAVYEKEPRIFYVASASGGVWKTENGGVTFDPQFQNENTVSIGAIAVSQKNPDVVYLGTGEGTGRNSVSWGDGVYKSTDGGKTWANIGLKETHHISRIIIDPKDDNTLYVGALGRLWGYNEERGLYKSTDAGKTWERVLYVDDKTGIADVEIDPKNPKILIAATYHRLRRAWDFENGGFGSGLWRTENGGKTWTKITKGLPEGRFISASRRLPQAIRMSLTFPAFRSTTRTTRARHSGSFDQPCTSTTTRCGSTPTTRTTSSSGRMAALARLGIRARLGRC